MAQHHDRVLWTLQRGEEHTTCVMRSCCSGAELQVEERGAIMTRELFPDKATLYERARDLEHEYLLLGWRPRELT